jgi:hypothetical protein
MNLQHAIYSAIALTALVLAGLAMFVAPSIYYDYKIKQCTQAQIRATLTDNIDTDVIKIAEALCHRYVNGVQ